MEVLDNGVMQARGGRPGAKHKARKCETNFTLICAQPALDGKAIFYGTANPFFGFARQFLIEMQSFF